ncbi:GNAT family N-acetyltransferase [Anaerolentibacter hominis]|uniref:GNAT family N-acetyltransferase n=1 Tax=Anaerolentibacter hominis TaxID=3079009 RepID=UPI0031B8540A
MELHIREFTVQDLPQMIPIWNKVVEDGVAFPQLDFLTEETAPSFFGSQTFTAVAEMDGAIAGLYILHPNNIGRCGHLANASYAVRSDLRGQHIGEALVCGSLEKAAELGFHVLQFNAVVKSNAGAIHLYKKLGFIELGTVPGGFLLKDGTYEDIILFYHTL